MEAPMMKTGHAVVRRRLAIQYVTAQKIITQPIAITTEEGLEGAATQRMLICVMRMYEGVSQKAHKPKASAAIPTARSQTMACRTSSHVAHARIGKKRASAVAP